MEHKLINYILLFALIMVGCNWNTEVVVKDFNSQVKFSSIYSKGKGDKFDWSIVQKMPLTTISYNQKKGQLVVDYGNDTDTFHVVSVDVNRVEHFSKSYGPFQFVNMFQNDAVPNDFYFLFYVNPANNDILEIVRSGGGKDIGHENVGFVFARDSVNYIRQLKLF